MSLRTKLIIMLLIFIIPTIGLMLVFHSRLITSYQDQVSSFQFNSTRLVAGSLKDFYFEGHDILHSVSFQNDKLLHPEECSRTLDRIVSDVKIFKSMAVVGMDGRVRCASARFTLPMNVSLLPAFLKAINRDEFALGDNLNYLPGDYVELSMAYPMEGKNANKLIILGVFDTGNIEAKLEAIGLPDKTEVFIFTPQGQILFPPLSAGRSDVRELIRSVRNYFNSGTLTERSMVIKGSDNLERTFRFVSVDMDEVFIISIGFPSGQFVSAANQFVTGNIAIISLLTLAILILAYGGIQISVIQPLNMISKTADALASGNYTARVRLGKKKDEIGRLGHNFDKMADALEESRSTLEAETNQKLAYQEKFFRLFEDSILGIFQLDRENHLVEANRALADMFGYTSDEEMVISVNSHAASIFVNQSDNEKINELISQRMPVRMETSFRKKDGSVFDGNLHMWGVWNAAGELEAMEGFVEDITDTKSTRQLVSKLSQAVEQNPIGIIITDGKGGIEYANQGIVKVFGYTPEELALKTMTELIPPSMSPEDVDQMRLALKNGHKYEREIQNYKKDGTPFWERFVVSPITPSHGKVTNTLCLVEDVTEQYLNRERIFQQVEELSALRTIDLAISSNLDLLATLNIISNLAVKHLSVDAVCILFYDAQCHMLHSAVTYGFQQDPGVDIPFPAAADLTDWELMEEFSIHIPENLKENKSTHLLPFPVEEQFQSCFGLPLVAKAEVKGLFVVYRKNAFTPEQHWLDFFYNLATQTAVALDNYELFRNLKQSNTELLQAYEATIEGWSKALKYRDQETEEHSVRTTQWTVDLAREMGYPVEELVHIRRGALLHDIGKVAVPDGILNKPGPLSESEWKEMKKHPVAAFEVLSPIQFLSRSLDIPYCHHERWNGTGYPRGLKGEEIPLAARIFSVIDVYDALTSDRPYRLAWPEEKVVLYLREQSGIQFDPAVVEAFLSILEKQKSTKEEVMKNHRPMEEELTGLGEQTGALIWLLRALPLSSLLVKEDGVIVYINPAGNELFELVGVNFRDRKLLHFNPMGKKIVWELKPDKIEKRFTFYGYPINLDNTGYVCLVITEGQSHGGGRYNEHLMAHLIEQSKEGVVIFDQNLRFIEWNKGMEQISGYSAYDVNNKTLSDFLKIVSPRSENPLRDTDIMQGSYRSLIKRLTEDISFNEIEVEFRRKDGDLRIAQYRMFPAFLHGRLYSGAIVRDVTEMRKAEETLRASESKFRTLVEAMGEAVLTLDLDLNILFSNPAATSMYGVEPDYFIGRNLREIIDNRYTNLLNRQIDRVKSGLSDRYEIEVADFRGNPHVGKVTSSPWRGANQEIIGSIIVFSDITQSKLTEEHLRFTSTHDEVTSLYNRNFYEEEKKRLGNGRRFPVTAVIIDLDDFKIINDTLGHDAGDRILRDFGKIIRRIFRAEDVVARIGGDEFAVLLPETDKQTAREAVERLEEAVAAHNAITPEKKIRFSVGTGTAKAPEELEDAIRRADTRMYREKKKKKNPDCLD